MFKSGFHEYPERTFQLLRLDDIQRIMILQFLQYPFRGKVERRQHLSSSLASQYSTPYGTCLRHSVRNGMEDRDIEKNEDGPDGARNVKL